jgi:hypothetical protein
MTVQSIEVKRLRPTQIAVGMRLVRLKRKGLRRVALKPQELVDYILAHPIRVVSGPSNAVLIVDHHHLGLALLKEGFKTAPVEVMADLSALTVNAFWKEMAKRRWVHPVDGAGKKQSVSGIPSSLTDMQDDPYRSLAGFVRLAGGFEKTAEPYVEFLWADYFRPLIKPKRLSKDFDAAVERGKTLARAAEARGLPGYTGSAAEQHKIPAAGKEEVLEHPAFK